MTASSLVDLADRITVGVQRGAQKERVTEQVAQLKRVETGVAQLTPVVTGTVQLVDAAVSAGVAVAVEGLRGLQGRVHKANTDASEGMSMHRCLTRSSSMSAPKCRPSRAQ